MPNVIQLQLDDSVLETLIEKVLEKVINRSGSAYTSKEDINKERLSQVKAADFLGISQATLIEWKKQGKIPYEQIPGTRKISFYKEDLKNVLKQNNHLIKMPRK